MFDSTEVCYHYRKSDHQTLLEERLYIDGNEVIAYDFVKNKGFTLLKGSETLMPSITKDDSISRVKYVASNAILTDTKENDAFYHFELAESVVKRLVAMDKTQIFVTTHNTDFLSNDLLRPDCYFIIKGDRIFSLADATEKELRQAHNLQKMYKAGAFDVK